MKTSELIALLQEALQTNGDLDVVFTDSTCERAWEIDEQTIEEKNTLTIVHGDVLTYPEAEEEEEDAPYSDDDRLVTVRMRISGS